MGSFRGNRSRCPREGQWAHTAIGIHLAIHDARRSGDERLVERNRQHQMVAMVAYIPGIEQPAAGGLILKIECPVLRVRQFVVDVVTAKQERPIQIAGRPTSGITARGLLEVRQLRQETGGAIGRGRRSAWCRTAPLRSLPEPPKSVAQTAAPALRRKVH